MSTNPTLRPLDFQPVSYQGKHLWLLRDPLRLSDRQLMLPPVLAQLLTYMDGTRDVTDIQAAFYREFGEPIDEEIVRETLAQLDEACLLENDRSQQAKQEQLAAYRSRPYRPPALAGVSYPADAEELRSLFDEYAPAEAQDEDSPWTGRAIVSPHIDYERGGHVYAGVWHRAAAALAEAELVLLFGTDHYGGSGTVTLTQQAYATPFGVLPTAPDLVQALARAIGPRRAYDLELNHRQEHSVELSAVWLHYVYSQLGRDPAPMVPILCGSFQDFVHNGHHPAGNAALNAFVKTLRQETRARKVLAVASVDLAHVGPGFGDPFPVDERRRQKLATSDRRLIEALKDGDYARFYDEIAGVGDRYRICGFSSLYLMLRYLNGAQGREIAYEQCPADEQESTYVSICGLLLE